MTYSKQLYWKAKVKLWGILLFLIGIFVLDYIYGISRINFTAKTLELLFIAFLGFCFYPILMAGEKKLNTVEDKLIEDADRAQLGFKGEDKVQAWLDKILSKDTYIILPNQKLPGHKFDLDFIIIGPKGVVLLEVKNFTDKLLFSDDECFQIKNEQKNLLSPYQDPRYEVRHHAFILRKFFEESGHRNIRISKALVFVELNRISIEGSTGVYIVDGFDSLKGFLDRITFDPICTPEFCEKIKNLLKFRN